MATISSLALWVAAGMLGSPIAQDASTPKVPAPQPEKKICRRAIPTGSLMGVRICLTASEWKQVNDPNKKALERYERPGMIGCPPSDTSRKC